MCITANGTYEVRRLNGPSNLCRKLEKSIRSQEFKVVYESLTKVVVQSNLKDVVNYESLRKVAEGIRVGVPQPKSLGVLS